LVKQPPAFLLASRNSVFLKNRLHENSVPERWYSLDEGLKPDACIIYKNYAKWECFYFDERGNKSDYEVFNKDEEAYEYLWRKMEYLLKFYRK